jgi:hypothetical protein
MTGGGASSQGPTESVRREWDGVPGLAEARVSKAQRTIRALLVERVFAIDDGPGREEERHHSGTSRTPEVCRLWPLDQSPKRFSRFTIGRRGALEKLPSGEGAGIVVDGRSRAGLAGGQQGDNSPLSHTTTLTGQPSQAIFVADNTPARPVPRPQWPGEGIN